ncbi:MAG: transketolase [Candidatus Limnocylindrales bacterium]
MAELRRLAAHCRRLVIEAVYEAQAGHIGGPLSCADMLVALYFEVLRINPQVPGWPGRDRFILSKGHAAIGLYAVLALRGYIPLEELRTFDRLGSRLQGHPDMAALDCLDMSTGSLGQGLSPGVGMALGARLLARPFHTWVMLGDGETQEGQVWEAAMVAGRYELSNITAIVDMNGLQQYDWATEKGYQPVGLRPPLPNARAMWEALGWRVFETDGHDIASFVSVCLDARSIIDAPTVILARTVKGKGVSFMEGDYRWHARVPSESEYAAAIAELS